MARVIQNVKHSQDLIDPTWKYLIESIVSDEDSGYSAEAVSYTSKEWRVTWLRKKQKVDAIALESRRAQPETGRNPE